MIFRRNASRPRSYIPLSVFLAAILLILPARASEENGTPEATPQPGFISRFFNIFHHAPKPPVEKISLHGRKFALGLDISPQPLKLSETRQMKVTLVLTNKSANFVHLEFPTTQRIEILIRNKAGKLVTQWSEDQSFANEPSYVAINPGERIEYSESVPTREMAAGQPYTVEGFFPNYDDLKTSKTIVPE
jgi:hypothetical protein